MSIKTVFLTLAVAGLTMLPVLPAVAQSGGAIPGGVYAAFSDDAVGCDAGDVQNSGGFVLRLNAEGTRVVELISIRSGGTTRNVTGKGCWPGCFDSSSL